MEPRVQYATTEDGIRIAYVDVGRGPPLVYLQPHSHTVREWELPETREWYTLLAERHRLIRLDIRHFGLSQRDAGPITIDTCVADVEAVVGRLGLERFDLLGVSGLSAAAAAYAVRHPAQVEKLVMWAPAATIAAWLGEGTAQERRIRAMAILHEVDPDVMLELQARFMFGEEPRPDQLAFQRAAMRPEDFAEYDRFPWEMDVSSLFPEIGAPTLVVYPRRSPYMPVDAAERIAAAIPGSEFVDCYAEMYPFLGPDRRHNLLVIEAFLSPGDEIRPFEYRPAGAGRESNKLSGRELEVLVLLTGGETNQQIAAHLGLSPQTVDRHVANVYAKADVHNRAEATMWAVA